MFRTLKLNRENLKKCTLKDESLICLSWMLQIQVSSRAPWPITVVLHKKHNQNQNKKKKTQESLINCQWH